MDCFAFVNDKLVSNVGENSVAGNTDNPNEVRCRRDADEFLKSIERIAERENLLEKENANMSTYQANSPKSP